MGDRPHGCEQSYNLYPRFGGEFVSLLTKHCHRQAFMRTFPAVSNPAGKVFIPQTTLCWWHRLVKWWTEG